jgi:type IV pilus assembly protein PilM
MSNIFKKIVKQKKTSIDWGTSAVKIAHWSYAKEGGRIESVTAFPIDDSLATRLKTIWEDREYSCTNVTLCLDGPETLVRVIDFPRVDKKAIRDSLSFELEHYTPYKFDEVYFDYSVIADDSQSDKIKMILALVKRDFLEEKLLILKEAGVSPSKVMLGPVVLYNAFKKANPESDQTVAIFDYGYNTSMLTVVDKGSIVLAREIKRGIKELYARVGSAIGMDIASYKDLEANKFRVTRSVLHDVTMELCSDVRMSFDYIATKENLTVSKIFVTGGMSTSASLWDVFSSVTGIEVVPLDVTSSVAMLPLAKKQMEESGADFSVAVAAHL